MHSHYHPFYPLIAACGPFERAPVIAVAVSGGADSMALLLLADAWAKMQGGHAIALTVDHGLREESAVEARQVKTWCDERGIEQRTLRIQGSGFRIEGSGVQASAREARYRLLADYCKENYILHLLTAHHRDDQAETLLFRLGRGSGIDGLACMPAASQVHGIRLLRPLLAVPKSQLKTLLMASRQSWIEDPSNRSPKYTRNRLRALIEPLRLSEQTATLAIRFGQLRAQNDRRLAALLPGIITIFPDYASVQLEKLMALPPEDGLRALSALVVTLSGRATPPRTEKLERLYAELPIFRHQRSFANLIFIRGKQGNLLVRPLEKQGTDSHILPMRPPVKALAGAPFFVMNGYSAPKEGARALYA